MKISLNNAVTATSEYLSSIFGNMKPTLVTGLTAVVAHYKLQTQGNKMLQILADEDGYINLDVLEQGVKTYMSNIGDETFKTLIGDIKIGSDTPAELMAHLKKYGEN
jgi:uncharacterized protein YuzB (UPF0349 family)